MGPPPGEITVLDPPTWMVSSTPRGPVRILRTMVLIHLSSKPGPGMAIRMSTETWNTAQNTFGEMRSFLVEMTEEDMANNLPQIEALAEEWDGWADSPTRAPGSAGPLRIKATVIKVPGRFCY